jgi:hypothetical protein
MEEAINDNKKKILTEADDKDDDDSVDDSHENHFEIRPNISQFGDVRTSQEEVLKKTIR